VAKYNNGTVVPLQADELSTHRDGSVRFAVLSAQLNGMAANETRLVNFYTAAKTTSTPAIPSTPAWNLEIEATTSSGTLIAQPQAQLVDQIAQTKGRRLSGAVASEFTVVTPFKDKSTGAVHPHLVARMHVRLYDGGNRIRTELVMENTRTFTSAPGNITYALNVKRNGVSVFTQPSLTHYHHARWRKVLWTDGAEPQARLRHNMPYFVASRATWNYNLGLYESQSAQRESALNDMASTLSGSDTKPMGRAMLQYDFPGTGGRPEIGPVPKWTAMYLLTQDDRARASMTAIADAAAGVPIHYREEATDLPLSIERNPRVTVRFGVSTPALPSPQGSTPWNPDTAHQGSFAYIPYLITGDAFYLDELQFWATYNVATLNPDYRGDSKGLLQQQGTRAAAWGLRSLVEASFATPDNHPLKSYFSTRLTNNVQWYASNYTSSNPKVSPLGIVENNTDNEALPWQNDFLTLIFSWLSENNEPQAQNYLNWIGNFTVGRFVNDANGFCSAKADGYVWKTKVNGSFAATWKTLFDLNYPSDAGTPCSSIAYDDRDCPFCYNAIGLSMLAATTNNAIPGASAGYAKMKSKYSKLSTAFLSDPTWAIIPR
jgi:hypothetical protein